MKAVRIHSYGGTEVLVYEDAPQPTISRLWIVFCHYQQHVKRMN